MGKEPWNISYPNIISLIPLNPSATLEYLPIAMQMASSKHHHLDGEGIYAWGGPGKQVISDLRALINSRRP